MADEILRSKHAFGNYEDIGSAVESGKVDKYDVIYSVDKAGKAHIGWVDKNGEVVMVTDEKADLSQVEADVDALESNVGALETNVETLETEMAKKADAESVNAELDELNAGVAGIITNVAELETAMESKVDATTVQSMIEKHVESMIEVVEF